MNSKHSNSHADHAHRSKAFSYLKRNVNRFIGSSNPSSNSAHSSSYKSSSSTKGSFATSRHNQGVSTENNPTGCRNSDKTCGCTGEASPPLLLSRPDSVKRNMSPVSKLHRSSAVIKSGALYSLWDSSMSEHQWRPFHVVLRGHRLNLYKLPADTVLGNRRPSTSSDRLDLKSFDNTSQAVLRKMAEAYVCQEMFDTGRENEQANLLVFTKELVICQRRPIGGLWKIQRRLGLQGVTIDIESNEPLEIQSPIARVESRFSSLPFESDLLKLTYTTSSDKVDPSKITVTCQDEAQVYTTQSTEQSMHWAKSILDAQEALVLSGNGEETPEESIHTGPGQHPDLRTEDGRVTGGSTESLTHELLYQALGNQDDEFTESFLLTSVLFTLPCRVLKKIRLYLKKEADSGNRTLWLTLLRRAMDILTIWCDRFGLDVVGDVAAGMLELLDEAGQQPMDEEMSQMLIDTREKVLSTIIENGRTVSRRQSTWTGGEGQDRIESVDGKHEGTVDLSSINNTGLCPSLFLRIHPDRFAEQVYMFHLAQYRIYVHELTSAMSYIPRSQVSTNMLSSLLCTSATPHFLTRLVIQHTLEHGEVSERVTPLQNACRLVEHWIRVALRLLELGDMTGWTAIAMGICMSGIVRLEEMWRSVDPELVRHVTDTWPALIAKHGMFIQDIWLSDWDKQEVMDTFAQALDANQLGLRTVDEPPGLPCFVPIRQAVDRMRRNLIHPMAHPVDFSLFRRLYKIIEGGLEPWRSKLAGVCNDGTDPFLIVKPLQTFFEWTLEDPIVRPLTRAYVYERSLTCEPRIYRQHFGPSEWLANDVAPPASSTLAFPEILESYQLYHEKTPKKTLHHPSSKTHPRNKGKNHSIQSIGSFFHDPSEPQILGNATTPTLLESVKTRTDGFAQRRRNRNTYSFPPSQKMFKEASHHALDHGDHTRTWLGSLVTTYGRRSSCDHINMDSHRKGDEWILSLHKGQLLLKASAQRDLDRQGSTDALAEKPPLKVNVKAGTLNRLVDVLVYGISRYQATMREHWAPLFSSLDADKQELEIDDSDYVQVFFSSYLSFCTCSDLLKMLHNRYHGVISESIDEKRGNRSSLGTMSSTNEETPSIRDIDWDTVAQTQLRILSLMVYWAKHRIRDFVDDMEMLQLLADFVKSSGELLHDWTQRLKSAKADEISNVEKVLTAGREVKNQIDSISISLIQQVISPCYDASAITHDTNGRHKMDVIYHRLMSHAKVSSELCVNATHPFIWSSAPDKASVCSADTLTAQKLLEGMDQAIRPMFLSVTRREWLQTFDVLEAQSLDLYAWLPTGTASQTSAISVGLSPVKDRPPSGTAHSHGSMEYVIISDVFTAIESARRSIIASSAFSAADDILLALPFSIRYLYVMHFIIRGWVVSQIVDQTIDLKTRVTRITTFLDVIQHSRNVEKAFTLFPELGDTTPSTPVPSFVEYCVASALVSPASRTFAKAWHDVAVATGSTSMETLMSLLAHENSPLKRTSSSSESSLALVPSLGWVFERILELSRTVQAYEGKYLLNFDKRRYMYHLVQIVRGAQTRLGTNTLQGEPLSFVLFENNLKPSWNDLKQYAMREHRSHLTSSGLVARSAKLHRTQVFTKLAYEQIDKQKREIKERDRIDREWRERQQKLQKRQLEKQRSLTRHEYHLPGKRLWRMWRSSRHLHVGGTILPTCRAAWVVSLISASISEVGDSIFRVVTEEGGQFQFWSENRDEQQAWMKVIREAARKSTAKRNSVLASQEKYVAPVTKRSKSPIQAQNISTIYGKPLSAVMVNGKLPVVAEKCMQEIERRGLEEVGIYRVAGTGWVVAKLKEEFNKHIHGVDLGHSDWADINVVADVFKQFLRELPEPLLTYSKYQLFINSAAEQDLDQRLLQLKRAVNELPSSNYILLERLVRHLVIITDYEAINHMYATNLAIVFGPTLLQPAPGPASYATTMSNLGHQQKVIQYLIIEYHYLFGAAASEGPSPPPSVKE